jgi:N-glycosylase/DNA lyase
LLENRVRQCKDQDIGIYFKLPWFYEEDIVYEEFKNNYVVTDLPRLAYNNKPNKTSIKLQFLKTTTSYQRKRKIERFWFTDSKYLYGIEVESNNPLMSMFKEILETKQLHTFNTYISQDRIDQMYFYKLFQFTFDKENNNA